MDKRSRWSRILAVVGLVAMLVGVIDPLEGSVVILAGSALSAVGALLVATRYKKLLLWSLALVAVGVGALWWLSALGGLGAGSGRSNVWWLALAPYPAGWVMGVVGSILRLREGRKAPEKPDAQ
jgi:hypothetical protein